MALFHNHLGFKSLSTMKTWGEFDALLAAPEVMLKPNGFLTADILTNPGYPGYVAVAKEQMKSNATGALDYTGAITSFLPASTFFNKSELQAYKTKIGHASWFKEAKGLIRKSLRHYRDVLDNDNYAEVEHIFIPIGYNNPDPSRNYLTISLSFVHPFSLGFVHINTTDSSRHPIIDPRYLQHEADLDLIIRAFKWARSVFKQKPLVDIIDHEISPGENITTNAQITSYVRGALATQWHPMGTCSMMPREEGGVVDKNLYVYGVKGLRIVDTSIIPIAPATHLQVRGGEEIERDTSDGVYISLWPKYPFFPSLIFSPSPLYPHQTVAYAFAERAADLIKNNNQVSRASKAPLPFDESNIAA